MRKFFALVLSLCLSLSILSVPVFACEIPANEKTTATSLCQDNKITPRDVNVLWSTDGTWFIDSYPVRVTPTKGTNLKIIIRATDVCKIEVIKSGSLIPSKTITYQAGSGTKTIDLVNNCNGNSYIIRFTNNSGVTIIARVVQTEYI